jgi:uncharacterized protein (DUF58 family)
LDINFARLNHILIPSTKAGRDCFRASLLGKLVRPFGWLYGALSEEGRVLAVAATAIGGFGMDVQSTEVYLLWALLTGLLVASLAVTRLFRLDGVRVEVDAPRRVTLGDAITFAITLRNAGDREHHAVRVRGPFLPWDGRYAGADPGASAGKGALAASPDVARLPPGGVAMVAIRARFSARGEHHLDPFTAAALVPFGLAQGAAVSSPAVKFLVVPKIARVVPFSTPPGSRYQPGGVALASKTGESMDLLGVRPYRAGDPVRLLHARSWARTGSPVVREYQEEYFSRIGVVVDAAAPDARTLEAILSLAAGVVAHLSRGEALIDLLVVGDRVHDLTIGRNLGFLEQALDLLAAVQIEKARVAPDALVRRLAPHLARLSCVVVVTPAWDRGALAERIRSAGVACTTLVVGEGASVRGNDLRYVAVSAIERGEAIAL